MEDLIISERPDFSVLRIIQERYTKINGNNGLDDGNYNTFLLHSKSSTIQSIRNRTANFSVPEGLLESFIIIDDIDCRQGVPPSEALPEAFSAVAVHQTLRWLGSSWFDYYGAVTRIWGKLIKDLEVSGYSRLLSPRLANWREEVVAALWDQDTSQRLSRINTLDEALRCIHVYLEEVFVAMNYTAVDVANSPAYAPTEGNGDTVVTAAAQVTSNVLRSNEEGNMDDVDAATAVVNLSHHCADKVDGVVNGSAQAPFCSNHSTDHGNVDDLVSAPAQVPSSPHPFTDIGNVDSAVCSSAYVPLSPHHLTNEENEDNVVIAPAEVPLSPHCNTDKANEIRRAISRRKHELRSFRRKSKGIVIGCMEEDRLDDGWNGAPSENAGKEIDKMDGMAHAPAIDLTAEPSHAQEEAINMPKKVCSTSLMESNGTACTVEWEDPIDVSSEGKDGCLNGCTSSNPRTKQASLRNIDVSKTCHRRRKANRWTVEEENVLIEGINRYGNQWKYILEINKEIFRERSSVDLKDKWRNLQKR